MSSTTTYDLEGVRACEELAHFIGLCPDPDRVALPFARKEIIRLRTEASAYREQIFQLTTNLEPPARGRLESRQRARNDLRVREAALEAQLAAKREELATTADPVLRSVAGRGIVALEQQVRDLHGFIADASERVRVAQVDLDAVNARLASALEGAKQVLARPVPV